MVDPDNPQLAPEPEDQLQAATPSQEESSSGSEIASPMLEVHAPHESIHTWKDFFVHIATIVVGLFIAVALEQSVEAIHRHSEVANLREDLQQESRQILADANNSQAAHLYEIGWLTTRIAQT